MKKKELNNTFNFGLQNQHPANIHFGKPIYINKILKIV